MEKDISKKKRKKSMAKSNQASHALDKDEQQKKLYEAAGGGHHKALKEILGTLENEITEEIFEEIVLSVLMELRLNNVSLTEEVELTLHEYVWKRCFFSKGSNKMNEIKNSIKSLDLIVDYTAFFDDEQEVLIFSFKYMVRQINILKNLLRQTYSILPWNEIEFYLRCYITLSTEISDLNIFYASKINKTDVICYLQHFMKILKGLPVEGLKEFTELPDRPREEIVEDIIKSCSVFKKLYSDVGYIRDLYSLHKISKYGKMMESISPQEIDADKLMVRALTVISEHLKHTLDTPNLSPMRGDLLLLSVSQTCRDAILALIYAVSSEDSFITRRKLMESLNSNFLGIIYEDIKQIGQKAEDLLLLDFVKLFIKNSSQMNKFPDILKQLYDFPTVFLYADEQFKNCDMTVPSNTKKIVELLNVIIAELEKIDYQHEELKKIVSNKVSQKEQVFKWKNIFEYLSKPEVKAEFLSYHKPGINNESIRALLDILMSIQKDCIDKNAYNCKIDSVITEIINLLNFEIDDDDLNEKLKDAYRIMRAKFPLEEKSKWNSSNNNILSEYKESSKKAMDRAYVSFTKLKPKLLEIMKAHALDTIINLLQIQNKQEQFTGIFWMMLDHLKSDYDWNDLIFNPTIVAFYIAKNHESLNFEKKITTFNYLLFIYLTISRKIEARSKLNEFEQFKELLKKGADIRARDTEKSNYLHLAVEKCKVDQIKQLLDEGVSFCKNLKFQTPLHVAAEKGKDEVVSYFAESSNEILHHLDIFGRTALHVAVLKRHRNIVEILVKAGLDPFDQDHLNFSPALYAVLDENKDILILLLSNEENIDKTRKNDLKVLFQTAINYNYAEIVELLISNQFWIFDDEYIKTVMTSAISNGHIALVETFLRYGHCPRNCILIAVQKNFEIIVEKILEREADGANASNPENGMTALHYAAMNGNTYLIDLLLRYDAKIETRDLEGNIPLHVAVTKGKLDAVKILLERTRDFRVVSTMNSKRYTPLHIAAEAGFHEISELLIEHWAEQENEDFSVSPLSLAISNNHRDIVELIRNNLNTRSKKKNRYQNKLTKSNKAASIPITKSIIENATIIIRGAAPDDLKCSHDEILTKIINQNGFQETIKPSVEVLMTDIEKGTIKLLLKKSIYEQFMNKQKLNIGFEGDCGISDYFYIFRCYRCAGFGHDSMNCTNEQVCKRCSGSHSVNDCKNAELKCFHCLDKNKSRGLNLDINHSPLDQFCPWYRKLLKDKYDKQLKSRK